MKNIAVHCFKQKKLSIILHKHSSLSEKKTKTNHIMLKMLCNTKVKALWMFPMLSQRASPTRQGEQYFSPQTFIFENGINTPSSFPKLPKNRPIGFCENQYLHPRSSLLSKELTPTMMV